ADADGRARARDDRADVRAPAAGPASCRKTPSCWLSSRARTLDPCVRQVTPRGVGEKLQERPAPEFIGKSGFDGKRGAVLHLFKGETRLDAGDAWHARQMLDQEPLIG